LVPAAINDFQKDRSACLPCILWYEEQQVARVVERSGLRPEEVRAIMATQVGRAERLAAADDIIDNSGPIESITPRVVELDAKYRALAARVT